MENSLDGRHKYGWKMQINHSETHPAVCFFFFLYGSWPHLIVSVIRLRSLLSVRFGLFCKHETLYFNRNSKEVNTHQTNQPVSDKGKISNQEQKKGKKSCVVSQHGEIFIKMFQIVHNYTKVYVSRRHVGSLPSKHRLRYIEEPVSSHAIQSRFSDVVSNPGQASAFPSII